MVLLLPTPSFLKDTTSIWDPVIINKIIPLTQKVAFDTKTEVLDVYRLFIDKPSLFPDKVHPSSLGALQMARCIFENVVLETEKSTGFDLSQVNEVKQHNFHGFVRHDFMYKGVNCKIVRPKRIAKGKPWVLRARFFGHEPQTDIALLERGFHIAYCDVSNLFGNQEAVERWDTFYQLMFDNRFAKQVVLEGMSRGGLIVYNWAAENPEKVACVYADAPVLDGTSWPGGKGKGTGSAGDWENFKSVFNIASDEDLTQFKDNPIHKTTQLAKAGFPMIHVCGEDDTAVPVDENTGIFEQKIKEAGGNIEAIYKTGVGHHPHSLQNPTPIVDFILRATKRKMNFATMASPGSEYRSAAGWREGKDWWAQAEEIDSLCGAIKNIDLLLIGNSITQGWGGGRAFTAYHPGQDAADTYLKNLKFISAGISGDRTEHILWRLKHGNYNANKPKVITLAIGVNNFAHNNVEEISAGIIKVVEKMELTFPDSKILCFGPLPAGLDKNSEQRKKYETIHESIKQLEKKKSVHYYNLVDLFSDQNGNLKDTLYSPDGVHLKPEGYKVWGQFIREKHDELIKRD